MDDATMVDFTGRDAVADPLADSIAEKRRGTSSAGG
jgi:hypothetical protein